MQFDFLMLGPVCVRREGAVRELGGLKQRTLAAALIVNANKTVGVDRLYDLLWEDHPPRSARANTRTYAAALRTALADGDGSRLIREPHGLRLRADAGELDLVTFDRLTRQGEQALAEGQYDAAERVLTGALALWRDTQAGADVARFGPMETWLGNLERQRLDVIEDLAEVRLHLGQASTAIGALRALTADNPTRERAWLLLARSLYLVRDVGAAAESCVRAKRVLRDSGLDTSQELDELLQAVLNRDPQLDLVVDRRHGEQAQVEIAARPAESPHELPPRPPLLVGRSAELGRLLTLFDSEGRSGPTVVNLFGPAGVGTSTLAIETAYRVSDRFPDGQLYLDLRGSDHRCPALAVEQALARLTDDVAVLSGLSGTQPLTSGRLRSALAERRVLLVLDNVVDSGQVRGLIPAEPRCGVVLASRRPLATLDAILLRVPELDQDAAVELLEQHVGARRIEAERKWAQEIGRLCDGLPLALRSAAARMAGHPQWSLEYMAQRLADPQARLDELVIDDLSIRSRLMATFEQLAEPVLQELLAIARRDPGESTTEISPEVASALVEQQLVEELGIGRYHLRELPRLVAVELAAGSPH